MLKKIFGGLRMSWPRVILLALAAGVVTALAALLAPEGNSIHEIAVHLEFWILLAILILVNCEKPLEAACKTFVFFLISQPLVYLLQVPFSSLGWQLFSFYKYWFFITLLTFPGAFLGWYVKRDDFWAGLILSVMLVLLIWQGVDYFRDLLINFPNHLLSVLFCFGLVPVLIFGIFRKKPAILTAGAVSLAALILALALSFAGGRSALVSANILEAEELGVDESWTVTVGDESVSSGEIRPRPFGGSTLYMSFYKTGENTVVLTDGQGVEHRFLIGLDEEKNMSVKELPGSE